MTLMMARYDYSKKTYIGEAFCFDPMPLIQGRELDADVGIYLACYARAGVMPTGPSLLFMGDAARRLFLRRGETREAWYELLGEIGRRHASLVAHDAALRARVSALATGSRAGTTQTWRPTMPEVCVGSALLALAPSSVTIVGDAPLPGGRGERGHVRRCDFHVASDSAELRIEVAGLIGRTGVPPTIDSIHYAQTRLPARLAAYAALGLPAPVTIYADEIVDRSRLLPIIADVVSQLI